MPILVLGLSHHTAPVAFRERFAFEEARMPEVLERLRQSGLAEEAVILSTCNRVEIYAVTRLGAKEAFAELLEFLKRCHDFNDPLNDEIYKLAEPQSVEHLFRVADRKSTRLNSSHRTISYAVFCLNKKTSTTTKLAGFAGHSGALMTSAPFKTPIDPPP